MVQEAPRFNPGEQAQAFEHTLPRPRISRIGSSVWNFTQSHTREVGAGVAYIKQYDGTLLQSGSSTLLGNRFLPRADCKNAKYLALNGIK